MATTGDRLRERLTALMERPGAPSVLGFAVVENSAVAQHGVIGAPPGVRFQAGSISKTVAAAVALELVARRELDLDADVNKRLTSWHLPGPETATLRQLLGHTAGVGVPYCPGYSRNEAAPSLVQALEGTPPCTTPPVRIDPAAQETFSYSGGAYAVVQQLVADVSGTSFADAARALVLDPHDMADSTFAQPLPAGWRDAAARPDWRVYPEAAAAGLWTTPVDLARFVGALQTALADGESAIQADTAALLTTAHAALPPGGEWEVLPTFGIRAPDAGGLGTFLVGSDRFMNAGGAFGFFSVFTGSRVDGTGAVVMTTSDPSPVLFDALLAMDEIGNWTGFRLSQ